MNYLPFAGYWFYGAGDAAERASFFSSGGLLDSAPSLEFNIVKLVMHFKKLWEINNAKR
jgi:hypothetical protein